MSKIIKSKLHTDYSIVPNEILRRADISAKAKGLFCYLNSLPENWVIYKKEVENHFSDGRESINSAFIELEKNGYLIGAEQINKGKFSGKDYILYQYPYGKHPDAENPQRSLQETRNGADAENPQLLSTNKRISTNKEIPDLDEFILYAKENKPNISLDAIRLKYKSWTESGWRDGNDRPIKNWKTKLLNTLPYMIDEKVKPKNLGLFVS